MKCSVALNNTVKAIYNSKLYNLRDCPHYIRSLMLEREHLYEKYADIIIDVSNIDIEATLNEIKRRIK